MEDSCIRRITLRTGISTTQKTGSQSEVSMTIEMETSTDNFVWEKDARYFYYKHGPLARTILGQNQVQGIDYAYTLQGWLKGVNSTVLGDGSFDMGGDGKAGGGNSNIARDAYGFALSYYNNDTIINPYPHPQNPLPMRQPQVLVLRPCTMAILRQWE